MKRRIKIPKTKTKQKEILSLLLKFRFLNTNQLRKILKHKNSNRTLEWLKDLTEKKCMRRTYDRTSHELNTKPAIYCLSAKSRHVLAKLHGLELSDLEYIYKEHRRNDKFISHCLFLADIYLYLLSNQDANKDLKFFTKFELAKYEYFPDPLPDAFIAVKSKTDTNRYMLDYFDENTPPFVVRNRIRKYIEYVESGVWDENTNFTPFPSVLLVFASDQLSKHAKHYGKSQLERTYEDNISFFITTKTMIKYGESVNIWEKIE